MPPRDYRLASAITPMPRQPLLSADMPISLMLLMIFATTELLFHYAAAIRCRFLYGFDTPPLIAAFMISPLPAAAIDCTPCRHDYADTPRH